MPVREWNNDRLKIMNEKEIKDIRIQENKIEKKFLKIILKHFSAQTLAKKD